MSAQISIELAFSRGFRLTEDKIIQEGLIALDWFIYRNREESVAVVAMRGRCFFACAKYSRRQADGIGTVCFISG